jgi:ribonuclease R
VQARITGVQNFGFFATVEGVGGDGLVPVSTLGKDYFHYDEASQTLIGEKTRQEFRPGMRLELRLAEANPVSGSLRFELPDGATYAPDRPKHKHKQEHKAGKYEVGKRGRPKNIRHQGKRR